MGGYKALMGNDAMNQQHVAAGPWSHGEVPDLVIMAGQSNMRGYKVAPTQEQIDQAESFGDRVHILCGSEWRPLRHGAGYQHRGFGPEFGFAAEWLKRSDRPLAIVKVAQNASWMQRHWRADKADGLFQHLIGRVRDAMGSHHFRVVGLVWMQGEADALQEEAANAYASSFEKFLDRLKLDLGVPDLPIAAGIPNPDAADFPHIATVREAIERTLETEGATASCEGLSKQPDGLHYDGPALDTLGCRFAEALAGIQPQEPTVIRRWLWNSDQYHCWSEYQTVDPTQIVVSLPHAVAGSGFDERGFGQNFIRKKGLSAIYVRMGWSNWFQDEEILRLGKAVRTRIGDATCAVYGASMGAYGALLLSDVLKADTVISVAPQFSIDRSQVPFETRWRKAARRIGPFLHDLDQYVSHDAKISVLYDPRSLDLRQIELIPQRDNLRHIAIPHASHQVLQRLNEAKCLQLVLEDVFGNGPPAADIIKAARKTRRQSKTYWLSLAGASAKRRPKVSIYALEQARLHGGPKRKINKLRALIDQS